jgi:cytochrome bd-type quinol oxidase subunit 2
VPSGVRWVDADLAVPAVGGPGGRVSANALPTPERLMESDPSTLWALVLWLQALIVVLVAAIWAWHRWDKRKAWVVFVPAILLVALGVSGEIARLLPNLL